MTETLLPYYLSNKWLTKDPPKGLKCFDCTNHTLFSFYLSRRKDTNGILAKCHKNTYNYCDADHRKKAGDCVKGMAGSLMVSIIDSYCLVLQLKYGAMAYRRERNTKTRDKLTISDTLVAEISVIVLSTRATS